MENPFKNSARVHEKKELQEKLGLAFDAICFFREKVEGISKDDSPKEVRQTLYSVDDYINERFPKKNLVSAERIDVLRSHLLDIDHRLWDNYDTWSRAEIEGAEQEQESIYQEISDLREDPLTNIVDRLRVITSSLSMKYEKTRRLEEEFQRGETILDEINALFKQFSTTDKSGRRVSNIVLHEHDISSIEFDTFTVTVTVNAEMMHALGVHGLASKESPIIFVTSNKDTHKDTQRHEAIHVLTMPGIEANTRYLSSEILIGQPLSGLKKWLSPQKVIDGQQSELIAALEYANDYDFGEIEVPLLDGEHEYRPSEYTAFQTAGKMIHEDLVQSRVALEKVTDPETRHFIKSKIDATERLFLRCRNNLIKAHKAAKMLPDPDKALWLVQCGCLVLKPTQYNHLKALLKRAYGDVVETLYQELG